MGGARRLARVEVLVFRAPSSAQAVTIFGASVGLASDSIRCTSRPSTVLGSSVGANFLTQLAQKSPPRGDRDGLVMGLN